MMKKINKKLISSIILGLILYTPVTNVYAAELNDGAIYGNGDNYDNYKDYQVDTDTIVYDFSEASSLVMNTIGASNDKQYAVFINGNQSNITINNKLDIFLTNDSSPSGFYIFNNAQGKTIDRSMGGDITINSIGKGNTYGAGIIGGSNNRIFLGDANINLNAAIIDGEARGLYVTNSSNNHIFMENGSIEIKGNIEADNTNFVAVTGMTAYDNNTIETKDVSVNITVSSSNTNGIEVNAIEAGYGGEINTGNGDVDVYLNDDENQEIYVHGVIAHNGGDVEKEGGRITATAEGSGTLYARGVLANGGNIDIGIADITAQALGGADDGDGVNAIGLEAWDGKINFAGGSITASTDNDGTWVNVAAISAQYYSEIKVNEGTDNRVVINGNIYAYDDSLVSLNINTADSVVNGGIEALGSSSTINLNLENGSLWNATKYSEVSELSVNQGNIYVNTDRAIAADINIGKYSGTGNVSFKVDGADENGIADINTGAFVIDEAVADSFINVDVANNSINTLDIAKAEENLNIVANKVYYNVNDGNLNGKVVIKEGLITPEASGDLLFDVNKNNRGYVTNITTGSRQTATMRTMKNLTETAIVAWRQEDSTLSQRLGELRDSEDGQGIWVRMSRGEFEYDGEYKNQYNFFQMGYDWAADDWHYGAAISHNDGQTTYTYGDGENRSTSLSLYGTWLGDKGQYADIVLKQGRLSNDFDIYTSAGHTSGDYDAWGTSLSGEYGQKIALEDDWYVTPQAQLTLMRIGSEDYTTNNGINVHQDTLHSAVGRLGFELGKKIADKGSVYAKASLLHDFAGNAETYLSYNGFSNSYSQDIGDTWCEAGIGFNYKTGENSYVYADVVKTFGGDVETPWQWNAGMRWSF